MSNCKMKQKQAEYIRKFRQQIYKSKQYQKLIKLYKRSNDQNHSNAAKFYSRKKKCGADLAVEIFAIGVFQHSHF